MQIQLKAEFDHDLISYMRQLINKYDTFFRFSFLNEELRKSILHLCLRKLDIIAIDQNDSVQPFKRFLLIKLYYQIN